MNTLSLLSMAAWCPTPWVPLRLFQWTKAVSGSCSTKHSGFGIGTERRRMTTNNNMSQLKNSQPLAGLSHLRCFVLFNELRQPCETLKWFISAPALQCSKWRKREVKAISLLQSSAKITGRHKKSAPGPWLTFKWEEWNNEWKETRYS